ncbi:uncharacterized protein LOC116289226 isoform X2 [Actinia tenebrosa]|uniref:Uncharacterized protein LOC116289226 isoform X2 n=1 Tax=Actinia tenebrosa TaxID=6105 RepID=A0A6P8HHC3_ACTTE|nr:uncharacterized protein LOC116289226 isoform X2 [Actinia tenebrosa]
METQDSKKFFLYDNLMVETIRQLKAYIADGKGTLDELKDRFRTSLSELTENELEEIDNVKKFVEALEEKGVIGANNVKLLKDLAKRIGLEELEQKVGEYEDDCAGIFKRTLDGTMMHLKTVLSSRRVRITIAGAILTRIYWENPEEMLKLLPFLEFGARVVDIYEGSVVFVLKVSSISSLKRLWQSYKDGSLKAKLKKSLSEMEELKELSQEGEIDVEVTIDEEEYREVLWNLILLDVKGKSMKNKKSQRRHSVCCERDVKPVVVKGKPMKDARIKRRHSVCCERDIPEDIDVKEINRIAARWAAFKKEKEIARQCRLLIDGGTRALRDVFDSIHSPSSLHRTLLSTKVRSTLKGLRAEKIISKQQWDRLYPATKSTPVTSENFDITLLFVLLRNICGLTPPATGWDKPPVATDLSREADLARVKYYRNELYGHITETAVSDCDFEKYWSEISDVLVRLGGPHYKPEIERIKIEAMNPEDEKYFIGALEEWEEMEQTSLQEMERMKRGKRHSAVDASQAKGIAPMASSWASPKMENLNFARLCKLLIDGGRRALRDVFDSIHSPRSLYSTLLSTKVHSTLKGLRAKRILNKRQWDRLYPASPSTPVTSADFDITLLLVLLRNICGLTPPPTGWDKLPVATDLSREADLARVKYYRNELYGHITETAVSDSDFEKYWSEISDVLVRLGGPHYKPEIERMKIDTTDPEEEKNFIGALEEWEEMEQRLIRKMEEILKKVKGISAADASQAKEEEDKKIRTDDIFTSVTIQRGPKHFKEPKERRFGRRQFDGIQASSTKLKSCSEMFLCPENDDQQSTASCTTNPKSILLTGKAGIGKSLFCRKLVRDWSHNRLFEEGQENAKVPDFQFVFLLTFRQLVFPKEKRLNLRDILNRSSLLNEHSVIDEPLLQYMNDNPEKLLIIIDGYDEYKPHREKITGDFERRYPNDPDEKIPVPALIAKIIKGKMLNGAVVLISSRPEEAEELQKIVFDVRCDIQGFSSLQVLEYIEKYFKENESMKNKALDHIKTNEILLSFGHIPVMCFLMCYCIKWYMTESKTTEKLPVTRTELYRQVIKVFIKKHSSSKYEEMEETKVQEILYKLAELAVNLMMEDKYIFDENDMKKFNLNDEEITNLKASGLLDCCPGVKKSPFEKPPLEYTFTHLTIQEYLCAFLFVEKKQIPMKQKTSDVTFMFMAGMFSREKDEKLMKKLIENIKPGDEYDERNKLLTLSCLYEYKDDGFSTRVINNLKHRYCDRNGRIVFSFITDIDCLYISYLLDIVNLINAEQTKQLYIRLSSLSASGIRMLCNSLVRISNVDVLSLIGCKLDDVCVKIICDMLPRTKITELALRGNDITDVGVKIICDMLPRSYITHLDLSWNKITDVGAQCLCSVLIRDDCRVKVLDLHGNNNITSECALSLQQLIPGVRLDI